jgi:serine O-acetyltransferase
MQIKNNICESDFSQQIFKDRKNTSLRIPFRDAAYRFTDDLLALLFPHYSDRVYGSALELDAELVLLRTRLTEILKPFCSIVTQDTEEKAGAFFDELPEIYNLLKQDADAILNGDPAAYDIDEVMLTYPGFYTIAVYRLANNLYKKEIPYFPRLLTEYAHQKTGIDIHPGAEIGRNLCIDHGTGIVIGETSVIGDNVKIYQGVTLGALSVAKKMKDSKRHPTIGDDVVIYSGATILGGETKVGKGSIIGGNVWLTKSVPDNSVVYHISKTSLKTNAENEPINFVI